MITIQKYDEAGAAAVENAEVNRRLLETVKAAVN
jgi:hypothetical protein